MKFIRRFLILTSIFLSHYALSMTGDGDTQVSTNKIVEGILSFSYWPNLAGQPLLCVSKQANYFNVAQAADNHIYKVVAITDPTEFISAGCNAIYFGRESVKEQDDIIHSLSGKNILTITENNADCVAGASFCLIRRQHIFKFSVNLDSLTRSGVRVNADVLLLSKDGDE
ncbi:YfiR family protein [Rosenbergiella nectarea]|uniref:YfiR family protein n=1 Tax=Rosenbergiella nectarea TaxID=988801 RepID=UPI001BDA42AD|nr:YfiR family protein [Rosenbergiella nectarea subsp. apis]